MFDPDPIRFDDVEPPAVRSLFADDDPIGFDSRDDSETFGGRDTTEGNVTSNREGNFSIATGRFRNPNTGEFEIGGSPPDYDSETNRFRGQDGRFKKRAADLYDEPAEARFNDLSFKG